MSYVIQTKPGSLIVIDGGTEGDATYLKGFIAARGNHVHTWIITHAHDDHFGALTRLLADPQCPGIGRVLGSMPTAEWVRQHGYSKEDGVSYDKFLAALAAADKKIKDLPKNTAFNIDGVLFEVLAGHNPEITNNAINNSSLVMRLKSRSLDILFLADLGAEGGRALMASIPAGRLRADYLQMAHHGQNGVDEAFYKAVNPKVCLWPTPDWLWDNNSGKGKGSGPWQTLEVRRWMESLGVRKHIVMKDGLALIGPQNPRVP